MNVYLLFCITIAIYFTVHEVVDKLFHKISSRLIFHSNAMLNEYKNIYDLNDNLLKCIFHPSYFSAENQQVDIKSNLNQNHLLVPGYISPFKGQDILIKAVSRIKMDFKLIFMGKNIDEEYAAYLDNLVRKEGLINKVEFLGFVSDEEFIEEMEKAYVILIPRLLSPLLEKKLINKIRKLLGISFINTQSMSGVLTKAMAFGNPVICSKNDGFSEYVNSSRCIFCDDNVESWTSAISYILKNPDIGEKMSINTKKFVDENLRPDSIAKKHMELYISLFD